MTAAAVRPDLFTHLFATQRQHPDRRDLAASVLSVALHGSVAAALVWASTAIKPDVVADEPAPIPIVIASPDAAFRTETKGGHSNEAAVATPSVPQFAPPVIDPAPPLAPPAPEPWVPPGETGSPRGVLPSGSGPGSATGEETRGGFVISKVLPQLLNASEVERALVRNYPALLRDAGVGGRVVLWLLIDENGRVIDTDVRESSGQLAFDSAAARVGEIMRFSPGMNREDRVRVWVSLPVVFRTK